MKIKYGYQIRTKENAMRMQESGFFKKEAAEQSARGELKATDGYAQVIAEHFSGGRLIRTTHVCRIEAPAPILRLEGAQPN